MEREAWRGARGCSQSGFAAQCSAMRLRRCSGAEAALRSCPERLRHPNTLPPLEVPPPYTWYMSLCVKCMASLRPSPRWAPACTRYSHQPLCPCCPFLPLFLTPALCHLVFPSFIPPSSSSHPLSTAPPTAGTHLVHELVCELYGIPSSQPGVRPCLRQRRQPPTQQR